MNPSEIGKVMADFSQNRGFKAQRNENAKLAKELGIKIAINTDAHSTAELRFITAGINQARRAWLEARDVLNALPLSRLRKEFGRRRAS